MSIDNNGSSNDSAIRLALLEQSSSQNKEDIEMCQRKIAKVDDNLNDVKEVQNESLIVLKKMETNLEHLNEKIIAGATERAELAKNQIAMTQAFIKTDTKFKLIVAILAPIGLAMLGVAVKLLFFFPTSGG